MDYITHKIRLLSDNTQADPGILNLPHSSPFGNKFYQEKAQKCQHHSVRHETNTVLRPNSHQ